MLQKLLFCLFQKFKTQSAHLAICKRKTKLLSSVSKVLCPALSLQSAACKAKSEVLQRSGNVYLTMFV